MTATSIPHLPISPKRIEAFCQTWHVTEFSLFGSVLRDDFNDASDVDVLVELSPEHGLSLYDLVDMEDELKDIFGREVDLVLKGGLRNPFRRARIMQNRQVVYAA